MTLKLRLQGPKVAKPCGMTCTTAPRRDDAPAHHFFASSCATWATDYDPAMLIAKLKREGLPFNVWLVPGPKETPYAIEMYAPQIEGAKFIAFYSNPT